MQVLFRGQDGVVRTSLITFVIVLWIFTVFVYFVFQNMEVNYQEKIQAYKTKTDQIAKQRRTFSTQMLQIQSLVGYFCDRDEKVITRDKLKEKGRNEGDINVDLRPDKKLLKDLNMLNKTDIKERGSRKYYEISEKIFYEKVDDLDPAKLQTPTSLNVENALLLFEERISDLQADLKAMDGFIQKEQTAMDSEVSAREQLLGLLGEFSTKVKGEQDLLEKDAQKLKEIIETLENEKESEDLDAQKLLEIINEKKAALATSEELGEEIRAADEKFEKDKKFWTNKIRELQAQKYGKQSQEEQLETERKREKVEQQQYSPAEAREAGSVVFADPRARTVYIDLGENAKVVPGLKFDVYRPGTAGKKVYQGRIEVQKVMDKVSRATVLDQKDVDPVVGGDLIINPVYGKNRSVYFVFAGAFAMDTAANIKTMIEQIGGTVEKDISAKTNFVIVGSKLPAQPEQDPNYRAALNFGIPLLMEKDLVRYIGD